MMVAPGLAWVMAKPTLSNVQPVAQTSQMLAQAPARHASVPAHVPQSPPQPFEPHVLPVQSGLHLSFFFFRLLRFFFLFFLASTSVTLCSAPVASAARDSPNSPWWEVTVPRPPLTDIVREGQEGRHAKEADAVDLARVVGSLADDAPALARMGAAARERVVARYSWARHCEQLEGVLQGLRA